MYRYERYLRADRGLFPLSELASRSAQDFSTQPVMRRWNGDGYDEITYGDFARQVQAIARWLVDNGIVPGDRISLLAENRPEWGMVYLGVQAAGAIIVPVDSMMPPSGIRHIIANSESRFLFCSEKFHKAVEELAPISTLEKIIYMDDIESEESLSFSAVLESGNASNTSLPKRQMDELAAIIYTSGTTGHSKGVMLTQQNLMSNVAAASRILPLGPEDTFLSVLPMHHTYECTTGFLLPIYCGSSITYARSLKSQELLDDMRRTNVTIMVAVPLLYEKMYEGITRKLSKAPLATRLVVGVLFGLSRFFGMFGLRAGKVLLRSLREKAGMGSVVYFVSGGGPLDPRIADFFSLLGLNALQGFGLTETSPLTHVNLPARPDSVTVGPPISGVEQRIDNPNSEGIGEIVLRGPNIFKGYYKNDEATKEVLSEDGWFHTGDLGKIHPNDFLQITGRMKNMLVTAGGKNVYPEEIEHFLNRSRFIAESLVLGIPRPTGYGDEVAALIYPDYEQLDLYFEELGSKPKDEDVVKLIKGEIKEAQKNLQDYKRIHRFRLMEEEFQKTSTRKIKRYLYSGDMLGLNGENV
ncbi:MAG: AMP-binding protein [bacterium]